MRLLLIVFFSGVILFLPRAQDQPIENSIEGFAPAYLGESVEVYMYEDYLTETPKLLATSTVNPEDSLFNVKFKNANPKEVFILIKDMETHFYVSPGKHYDIYIPDPEEAQPDNDNRLTAQIFGLEEDDLNYKITSFDLWVDDFLSKHSFKIMDTAYIAELDTFVNYVQDYYKDEKDPYFMVYVRYSLAELQMMENVKNELSKRFMMYVGYIRKFPIFYGHNKYMSFILNFYDQVFNRFSKEDEAKIYDAVLNSSPSAIHEILKKDKSLENTALRELAMIQALGKSYHEKDYPQQMILNILDSIQHYPEIEKNGVIAENIYNKLTDLNKGNPAPELNIENLDGKQLTWNKLKGRYVYLSFFNTQNIISTKELKLITQLHEKYGEDITFISISTDKNKEQLKEYLSEHPKIDWNIAHYNNDEDLLKRFNVNSVPSYFLIDRDGYFMQAPALGPAPNSEYLTIDYHMYQIHKQLHPEKKVKIGEKEDY